MSRCFGCVLAIFFILARPGFAQEAGKKGVTIAYPASVGFIWHVTDSVAIRSDFSFDSSSFDSATLESSSLSTTLAVSALFYVKQWDTAAAYVSPRLAWIRSSNEIESEPLPFPLPLPLPTLETEATANDYLFSGSFGAQAWIGQRFSLFGEVGLAYSRHTFESTLPAQSRRVRTLGTSSGVGVVLYF